MKSQISPNHKKPLPVNDAVAAIKNSSKTKFIGSVNIDIVFSLSEKQKKEVISGSVVLPHQVGASVRVAVIAEGEDQATARQAGADLVGSEELISEIAGGKIDFDILIATPAMMRNMARLGKVLGPRGLMPNPKNETVTTNLEKVIVSYKAGKLNFKSTDQQAIRTKVGKVDMAASELTANITAFIKAVYEEAKKLNPQPFRKVTISPTMGAGVQIDINSVLGA